MRIRPFTVRWLVALGVVGCVLLLGFASVSATSSAAAAGFGVERYSLSASEESGSEDVQAGSHPYELTADVAFSQSSSSIDDLDFELPPGVVLDGRAAPLCEVSEFYGADGCGEDTAVGVAMVGAEGQVYPAAVYNLAPAPGRLAQLGFVADGVPFLAGVTLRPGGGMTVGFDHIPEVVAIASIRLTLWGVPGDAGHDALRGLCATGAATNCSGGGAGSFVTLPTACGEALDTHATALADSWQDPGEWLSDAAAFPSMTACERLPFDPAIDVAPEVPLAGEPSAYEVDLTVPQSEGPHALATSELRDAQIALPAGTALSLAFLDGTEGCSEAQFALESGERPSCPNPSTLGRADIGTPLLASPLEGHVYLAAPYANPSHALVGLYLYAEDQAAGVTIKLAGQIVTNPDTGQATVVFNDLPQVPIGSIGLKLFGGARGVLDNPQVCGRATSTGWLSPWSGVAQAVVSSSFEVESDHPGEACPDPPPFDPVVSAAPAVDTAGYYASFALTVAREDQQDDEQDLAGFGLQLPAGIEWSFASVPPCGEPEAQEGACPQASQIGTTTVSAGVGPTPAWFTGAVYLTGGYEGAPYGLSIAIDVIAGPLDLGEAVIRAPIAIDPATGAVSVTSDPLPTLIEGIPLQLRTFAITIDRSEFLLNSIVCDPGQITTTVQGAQGASVQSSTPFTDTGCQNPPIPPAATQGGDQKPAAKRPAATTRPAISHLEEWVSGDRLLLGFTTSVKGSLTITGSGIHAYTKRKLRAGRHHIEIALNKRGVLDVHRHRRFKLRLRLETAAGVGGAKVAV